MNINKREEEKARRERDVFKQFAAAANLQVDLDSIKNEKSPKPDLSCKIEGQQCYFEITEVVDQDLARSVHVYVAEETACEYSPVDPLIKAFSSKASKSYYKVDGPLNLLVYYDNQFPPLNRLGLIPKAIGQIAISMINSGHWSRLWVYDGWNKRVLWVYPNA